MSRYTNPEAAGYLLEAKACVLVLKELDRILGKFQRKVEREAADRRKELEAALGYESERDLLDAYGWGMISERQYDLYRELQAQGETALEHHTPTTTELALDILRRIRSSVNMDRYEWEYCAKTPEERRKAAESAREWRLQLQKIKESLNVLSADDAGEGDKNGW